LEEAIAVETQHLTAEDLWRLPDDGQRHESVDGELRTMPLSHFVRGMVTAEIGGLLRTYARQHSLGCVVMNVGFVLSTDPDTVRGADVAFIVEERLETVGRVIGYWPGAPDLAVEVISVFDLYMDVEERVAAWLEHGTRLVLVVNSWRQTVAVHRLAQPVLILGADDVLNAEGLVPGWSTRVGDLFA
jgi:Uma2 family endonuclease